MDIYYANSLDVFQYRTWDTISISTKWWKRLLATTYLYIYSKHEMSMFLILICDYNLVFIIINDQFVLVI